MKKGRLRRIAVFVLSLLLAASLFPVQALGYGLVDTGREVTLSVEYTDLEDGTPISGIRFDLYKVADMSASGDFYPVFPFDTFPISVQDQTVEGWFELAETLKGLVYTDDSVIPAVSVYTDEQGRFTCQGLEQGLYLLLGAPCTIGERTYELVSSMVALPYLDAETEEWLYDVTAKPKPERHINPPDEPENRFVTRRVVKVWDDKNNTAKKRPQEITVQLFADGEPYDEKVLSEATNWSCAWNNLPHYEVDGHVIDWTVAEKPVESYTVKVDKDVITFIVTNTYTEPVTPNPPKPPLPQTGLLWWPVPALAFVGVLLVIIGAARRRRCS